MIASADLGTCPQVQTKLLSDTSEETKNDLIDAVKTQQNQLDLLKKENEKLCKDVRRQSNDSKKIISLWKNG